jgi:hypothetical protein
MARCKGEVQMQAYKLKGEIDQEGHLVITEPLELSPGEVEILLWRSVETTATQPLTLESSKKQASKVKAFAGLFEKTQPVSPDFESDQAKWEYLKQKHNL